MKKETKKLYTENFDPLIHLKQSKREDGFPAYEEYIKDGVYVLNTQGRLVLVPKMHLDANAYREWFAKGFPDGRVEVVRHTAAPVFFDGKMVNQPEIMEVRLYASSTDDMPKANGFGRAGVNENEEYDPLATAISNAFKNAMRNMGCGTDITQEDYLPTLPTYVELEQAGKTMFMPEDASQLMQPGQLTAALRSKAPENVPSPVKEAEESTPTLPKQEEKAAPKQEPANSPAVKQTVQEPEDILAFLKAREVEDIPSQETEAPQSLSAEEAPEAEGGPVKERAQNISEEEKTGDKKDDAVSLEGPFPDPGPELTALKQAYNVVFETLSNTDPFAQYNGSTVEEIFTNNPSIIRYITKPTYHWEKKLPENVYRAIMTVAESSL